VVLLFRTEPVSPRFLGVLSYPVELMFEGWMVISQRSGGAETVMYGSANTLPLGGIMSTNVNPPPMMSPAALKHATPALGSVICWAYGLVIVASA